MRNYIKNSKIKLRPAFLGELKHFNLFFNTMFTVIFKYISVKLKIIFGKQRLHLTKNPQLLISLSVFNYFKPHKFFFFSKSTEKKKI